MPVFIEFSIYFVQAAINVFKDLVLMVLGDKNLAEAGETKGNYSAVVDPQTKNCPVRLPARSNSFVLTYIFAKKHPCRRLVPPPPQREILDPPM